MAKNIARNNDSNPVFLCNAASTAKFKGFRAWKFHNWARPGGMIPKVNTVYLRHVNSILIPSSNNPSSGSFQYKLHQQYFINQCK